MTKQTPNTFVGIPKLDLIRLASGFAEGPGINLALFIAAGALLNQRTWDNKDYSTHWLWVAGINEEHLTTEEKIVGILHDVVEDSDWEIEDLRALGFSERICEAVDALTKREGELYLDSVRRCSLNAIARKIKKRDNRHNMDLTRSLFSATPKQKYLYHISYSYQEAVDMGDIVPDTPIWCFLQMEKFRGLLNADSFPSIAAATSEPIPPFLDGTYSRSYAAVSIRPSFTPAG